MLKELLIQQLQDEILNLRKGAMQNLTADTSATNDNSAVQELKNKLKLAAKHIAQLARERQQLIEMGNKLRSELNKAGTGSMSSVEDLSSNMNVELFVIGQSRGRLLRVTTSPPLPTPWNLKKKKSNETKQ